MTPVRLARLVVALVVGAGWSGGAPTARADVPETHCGSPEAVLVVVDGAGGFRGASESIRQTVSADGLPWQVEAVDWTHGYRRVLADHCGGRHARVAGHRLACAIRNRLAHAPAITLLAHSSGCWVALNAAEQLPPDSVERIVFLAPAVSHRADLRPALTCARQGVDVFYSGRDKYLFFASVCLGTADRHWCPTAGRVGFKIAADEPGDTCLFSKLRQYPWTDRLKWSGNDGGHYGIYQPDFLRAYVFPLIGSPSVTSSER